MIGPAKKEKKGKGKARKAARRAEEALAGALGLPAPDGPAGDGESRPPALGAVAAAPPAGVEAAAPVEPQPDPEPAGDPEPEPEPAPTPESAATPEPEPQATPTPAASARRAAPERAVESEPADVLVSRIDALRARVDGLLELADETPHVPGRSEETGEGLAAAGASGLRGSALGGLAAAASSGIAVPRPASPSDLAGRSAPAAEPAAAERAAAERAVAEPAAAEPALDGPPSATAPTTLARSRPSGPAILVARELLARGMATEGVRSRLRDGYGVADPDVVLAALGH
jgi:hypothetical protein